MGRYLLDGQAWSIERDGNQLVITEPDGTVRREPLDETRIRILTNQNLRTGWKLEKQVVEARGPLPEPRVLRDRKLPYKLVRRYRPRTE